GSRKDPEPRIAIQYHHLVGSPPPPQKRQPRRLSLSPALQLAITLCYVCASNEPYRKVDYTKISTPTTTSSTRKDFIKPKLVTVIRSGVKPRKVVRILPLHPFISHISQLSSAPSHSHRHVCYCTLTCLQDFFGDDDVFLACGPEKFRYAQDDFVLTHSSKTQAFVKLPDYFDQSDGSFLLHLANEGLGSQSAGKSSRSSPSPTSPGTRLNGNRSVSSSIINDKYKVGKVIGDGNFAVVKECVERSTGQEYALKIIDKARCSGKEHLIENEVAVLRRVRHPSIIQLIEVDETPTQLFLVMELVKGGDLFDAITSSTKYSERDASAMVFNLAGAIKYLHRMNIVHRDIKPENLLVCEYPDGTKSLKLGDFGLATVVEGPLYTVCGTPTYVAPEIIAETGYGLKVDIWAAGVITYILLCGFPPFRSENNVQEELFDQILRGKLEFPSPDWDTISLPAKMLISQMLQVNVDARFTAEEVLSHPWVTVRAHYGVCFLSALRKGGQLFKNLKCQSSSG
uniref:non-specific serine/threonine protein kinase n=1 Tax=Monopterus albus TaxID=43700 RepID=A0A3Q3Q5B3_MONAL